MPFDFDAIVAPFRMQPGLRKLAEGSAQFTPIGPTDVRFRAKFDALHDHADRALVANPDFDPTPALAALVREASAEHPDAFAVDGDGRVHATRLGWSVRGADVWGNGPGEIGALLRGLPAAWRLPALLCLAFGQDFAIVDGATATIPWLAVCLPSRWAPEDKAGRHFAEVHAPVADNELLLAASRHLARLVTQATRWERFVWTITSDAGLMQHPAFSLPSAWPQRWSAPELAAAASLRTERQSFIPLPERCQAVFLIDVDSRPLAGAVDSAPRARALHDALASMSPAVLAYRGLTDARSRLLEWLATHAA